MNVLHLHLRIEVRARTIELGALRPSRVNLLVRRKLRLGLRAATGFIHLGHRERNGHHIKLVVRGGGLERFHRGLGDDKPIGALRFV